MPEQGRALEVLVLCSAPIGDLTSLKLPHELIQVEKLLRNAQVPVRMKRVFPPTIDQLRKELAAMTQRGDQPGVFHFLGHGDDDGLYFEDEFGQSQLVKGSELKLVLRESPVKLVLLNACWSATNRGVSLIEFLRREQVTESAIGHELPVADASAVKFAQKFYELAMSGKTVGIACQHAANSIAESGLPGGADVRLVGNKELKLTDGLSVGQHTFAYDDGMPRTGHLPDASVFFGRAEQLLTISRALSNTSLVGIGIWGIGGIGKSALALEAARRNAWRYRGTTWVDIRDATQKTTNELLRIALGRLLPGARSDDAPHALAQFLKTTPSLIVLDNLEDLPESELPALARFLKQIPRNGSHVLLTARVPMREVEDVPDVSSLKLTDGLDGWHGPHYVQHVAAQKNCLALKDDLRHQLGELETTITGLEGLCVFVNQRLHGHPKMLELAVGLAMRGVNFLNVAMASLPEHLEDQIRPLLETTFTALGHEGRKLLPLLIFFPTGRLTPEALEVAAIAASANETMNNDDESNSDSDSSMVSQSQEEIVEDTARLPWFPKAIQELVQTGLLDYQQSTNTYSFHQSILDAVKYDTVDSAAGLRVLLQLLDHYSKYIVGSQNDYHAIDRCFEEVMRLMEVFWSIRDASPSIPRLLGIIVSGIGHYFEYRNQGHLGEIWHNRAIEELRRTDDQTDIYLDLEIARKASLLVSQGRPNEARKLLTEAAERAKSAGNDPMQCAVLFSLAKIESRYGNPWEAKRLLHESNQFLRPNDERAMAVFHCELATVENTLGNHFEAKSLATRATIIAEQLGDESLLATLHAALAIAERSLGNVAVARISFGKSIDGFTKVQNKLALSRSLHHFAILEREHGDRAESRRLFQKSISITESFDNKKFVSDSLHELAFLEFQENPIEAIRLFERSTAIDESVGDFRGMAASLDALGGLYFLLGDYKSARINWEKSIEVRPSIDVDGIWRTKCELANLEVVDDNVEVGLKLAEETVRQFAGVNEGQASYARNKLRDILQTLLKRRLAEWRRLPVSERETQLLVTFERNNLHMVVLTWLAEGIIRFEENELSRCITAETQAVAIAEKSENADLIGFVELMRNQRLQAMTAPISLFHQLLQTGIAQLGNEQPATALLLLEEALAHARSGDNLIGVANSLFYLGQTLLMLDRTTDAVERFREALDIAKTAGIKDAVFIIDEALNAALRIT